MVIKLGTKVRDNITGYEGIATARAEYLNGCVSYQVESQTLKDGVTLKAEWFDEQRLTAYSKATAGGPQQRPPESHP